MPTLQETKTLQTQVQDYVALGLYELTDMLRQISDTEDPNTITGLLVDALPAVIDPYAIGISDLTTDFYMASRTAQGITSTYRPAQAAGIPTKDRLAALARWGVAPMFTALADPSAVTVASAAAPLLVPEVRSRIGGAVKGVLGSVQREGALQLAAGDPEGTVRYQRMARPGCCAFCAMLASRGAVYDSEAAATRVIGRGLPVSRNYLGDGKKRQGGQGRGVESRSVRRGSSRERRLGDEYHDHCQCVGVALYGGRVQQMDEAAADHLDAYHQAVTAADQNLELNTTEWMAPNGDRHMTHEWVNDAGDTVTRNQAVLAEMRKILGTK